MGASAGKVPRFQLPDWLVRIAAIRNSAVKQILPRTRQIKKLPPTKRQARASAGHPRSKEACIVACAESLCGWGFPVYPE